MIFCVTSKENKPNAYSKLGREGGRELGFFFFFRHFFFFPFHPIVFLRPLKVSIKFLKESRLLKCT